MGCPDEVGKFIAGKIWIDKDHILALGHSSDAKDAIDNIYSVIVKGIGYRNQVYYSMGRKKIKRLIRFLHTEYPRDKVELGIHILKGLAELPLKGRGLMQNKIIYYSAEAKYGELPLIMVAGDWAIYVAPLFKGES